MTVTLKNELITVELVPKGAELVSLKDNKTGTEHIWQANPDVWGRHAPILFPIVGKLKNDTYQYEGESYTMHQHGFARDLDFEVVERTDTTVTFRLVDTEATRAIYPFAFILEVTFTIMDKAVLVHYNVKNPTKMHDLYFSIGGHPGFNVPLTANTQFKDYFLHFDPLKSRIQIPLKDGQVDLANRTLAPTDVDIALNHDLFNKDALIYEVKAKNTFTIESEKTDYQIGLSVDHADYIGVWSPHPTKGDFVCIEPWWGIADDINATGDLTKKNGIKRLLPGEVFNAEYTISLNVNPKR